MGVEERRRRRRRSACVLAELGGVEGGVRGADGRRKDELAHLAGGEDIQVLRTPNIGGHWKFFCRMTFLSDRIFGALVLWCC